MFHSYANCPVDSADTVARDLHLYLILTFNI